MFKASLASLQDVLDVADDNHFEQLVAELPDILRVMRGRLKIDGHGGYKWPIQWRSAGGASMLTTHFPDGEVLKHQLDSTEMATSWNREYERLYKWRDAWGRLSSDVDRMRKEGRTQNRQERIERRARIANHRIAALMNNFDNAMAAHRDRSNEGKYEQ